VLNPKRALELHHALDLLAERRLRPGGFLVTFRPPHFPSPRHLDVLQRFTVDSGGIQVDLIQARKPKAGTR
jgi:hypothetical protein